VIGFLKIAVPVLLIHLFETTLLRPVGPGLARIDLMLLYLAYASFHRGTWGGAAIGGAIGLFRGVASLGGAGSDLIALAAAGAFAGWAYRKLVGETTAGLFLILFGMVFVHDLVRLVPSIHYGVLPFVTRIGAWTVPAGITTAAAGLLLRWARGRFRRPVEAAS